MNYSMNQTTILSALTANTHTLAGEQESRLNAVVAQANALNDAIARAVDCGLTIEVARSRRYHTEQAVWGDQVAPQVQSAR